MSTPAPGDSLPLVEQPPQQPAEVLPPPKPSPSTAAGRIQYLDSLRYVFSHPDWVKNLLIFAVFLIIPVVQVVLFFGYMYEIVEHQHRRLPGPYPVFQIRRFAAYMTRGIWCYLLANIVQVILALPIQVLTQGTVYGSIFALRSGDWGAVTVAVVVPLLIIGFLLFVLGLQVLMMPFMLRGGLTQGFRLTMNFRWIGHYLKTMWLETTLVCLFVQLTSMVMLPLGCVLFCFGFYVAIALIAMVQGHLHCQLYELYLTRGGEPIPLRPVPVDIPPVVQSSLPPKYS